MRTGFPAGLKFRQKIRASFAIMIVLMAVNAAVAGLVVYSLASQMRKVDRINQVTNTIGQVAFAEQRFARTMSREDADKVYRLLDSVRLQLRELRERPGPEGVEAQVDGLLSDFSGNFQKFVMEKDQAEALESRAIALGRNMAGSMDEARTKGAGVVAGGEVNRIVGQLLDMQWQEYGNKKASPPPDLVRGFVDRLRQFERRVRSMQGDIGTRRVAFRIIRDSMDYVSAFERRNDYERLIAGTELQLQSISGRIQEHCATLDARAALDIRRRIVTAGFVMVLLFGLSFAVAKRLATFLSGQITRPVNELVDVTRRIAAGERDARATAALDDEIGELARCFNTMTESLQRSEAALVAHNRNLEQRVEERTSELASANSALTAEIFERKQAGEALQAKERYQRALLDNFPFAVWLKDTESRFLAVNQEFARTFGAEDPDALAGRCDFDIAPVELARGYRSDDEAVMASRLKKTVEEEVVENGVRRWFQTYKAPVIADDGRLLGTVGFFRDITEQKEREKEHLKIDKLESLGVLAGGIAHDFNNILTGIIGNISFARIFLDPSHRSSGPLAEAEKASARATELARQLLTFARGGEPVKKTVSLKRIVEETVPLVLSGSNVVGNIDIPDSLRAVEADEGQIGQVLHNLVINAAQAMPDGGRLDVVARDETLAAGSEVPSLPPGPYVRLTLADEGCGIPDADLKKIFDPYFTTKPTGNGLGLASAHSIASRHGGHISAASVVGKGTVFTILLPSKGEAFTESRAEAVARPAAIHEGGSVLVMDDERMIRDLASAMLEELGYRVTTCGNGEEAVAKYKAAFDAGAPFAAAIMDLTIPGGMGGREAARQIIAIDPDARLVVSSGYSNDPILSSYGDFGFRGAVAKPYGIDELGQLMASLISGRS